MYEKTNVPKPKVNINITITTFLKVLCQVFFFPVTARYFGSNNQIKAFIKTFSISGKP